MRLLGPLAALTAISAMPAAMGQRYLGGNACTDDCSGHEAGYDKLSEKEEQSPDGDRKQHQDQ
jgi:hypothetical protein